MSFTPLTPTLAVSPQLSEADIPQAAQQGFRTIISNRPDGEEAGQLPASQVAELAAAHGMAFLHLPVVSGQIDDGAVDRMCSALARLDGPVLAYCRTGTRSATLWALTQSGQADPHTILQTTARAGYDLSSLASRLKPVAGVPAPHSTPKTTTYDVVIVGGGSAGIAAATSLFKRQAALSIAVIEPANEHFYQPGWTMVGAGVFTPEQTRHSMASVMPNRVTWIRQAVTAFMPDDSQVVLADGQAVSYRVLVAAPGLKLDWAAIPGLAEALGKHGVTSNYRYDLAPYTYRVVQELKGGRALFTQPPMPIKCAGAPQKAMYLSCDIWNERGVLRDLQVEFHNAGSVLFGVATYVPALMAYVERYGIQLQLQSTLVAVDGPGRVATFETKGADGSVQRIERPFDMLHAVPPQVAPDVIRESPLAGASGFVDVDRATLRHTRYPNIYALGDACSAPNAKTAAAARKQAPVVAVNVLETLQGRAPAADYDGYGSCPLTVERGKIILAEFGYDGKLLPSLPSWLVDGTQPTRAAWFLKAHLLPPIYWHGMLKGREWLVAPHMLDSRVA